MSALIILGYELYIARYSLSYSLRDSLRARASGVSVR